MTVASPGRYLDHLVTRPVGSQPPRFLTVVCHGHSIPAGYIEGNRLDPLRTFPHLLRRGLVRRFPLTVVNVIVTGIGGEHSLEGASRFRRDVLSHRPELVTIDYAANDRRIELSQARAAWEEMIELCRQSGIALLLMTPSMDGTSETSPKHWKSLIRHAAQIRRLAAKHRVGLVDVFAGYEEYIRRGGALTEMISSTHHPSARGHRLMARLILEWFDLPRKTREKAACR